MYDFEYHRPKSVEEAAALLADRGDAKLLAGGMSLLPTLKLRLTRHSDIVDLSALAGMSGIERDGNALVIGAMTRHHAVASSGLVRQAIPALATLAGGIGDPLVRNRGTIGGSIANADPAADYPAGVLGLGATIVTNKRTIKGDDFFKGLFETALQAEEIIVAVRFPIPTAACYVKFPNLASRFALVGVLVARTASGVRVAVTGAGPCVFRLADAEAALSKSFAPAAVEKLAVSADGLNSDIHATAVYRAHVTGVLLARAVAAVARSTMP
jgi:carbon-monoxide dehydrogenase medium subunit